MFPAEAQSLQRPMATINGRKPVFTSLTRISDLGTCGFQVQPIPKADWETGDYVVGEVVAAGVESTPIELVSGRMAGISVGDLVVGALGTRAATLEAVGDWRHIGPDGRMQALTGAGLFGRATSCSLFIPAMVELIYRGHAARQASKLRMRDFVPAVPPRAYNVPTVLLIGTSMSSGKTTSAKVIIRHLVSLGIKVAGVKLTGAGRYRDTLGMGDAGADVLLDFVDVGLPSTAVPEDEYRPALSTLLSMVAGSGVDVVVAEAGASPLEPYNGDLLIRTIRNQLRCTVLCASDPYAVVGVTQGFGFEPDFVAGIATSTSAGIEVIHRLAGIDALNLVDPRSHPRLMHILSRTLGLRS
jgi:hypothetical protein